MFLRYLSEFWTSTRLPTKLVHFNQVHPLVTTAQVKYPATAIYGYPSRSTVVQWTTGPSRFIAVHRGCSWSTAVQWHLRTLYQVSKTRKQDFQVPRALTYWFLRYLEI